MIDEAQQPAPALRLFLLGFITLFLELVLIRYLAGNIWNLGYFPNLVLLAVFVGMGCGFVFHHRIDEARSRRLLQLSIWVLLGLLALIHFKRPAVPGFSRGLAQFGGELFYTATPSASKTLTNVIFVFWFLLVVSIFGMISQRTAKIFRLFEPLKAYTLDISGSLCGILCFMAASWLQLPSWSWFVIFGVLFTAVMPGWKARFVAIPVLLLIPGMAALEDTKLLSDREYKGAMEVRWSPYQKVEYAAESRSGTPDQIFVNGVYHQNMNTAEEIARTFYSSPYQDRASRPTLPPYKTVLVIGAGSGNDVEAALMHGVEHIDAVEIDPVIASLGRKHHPARPYDDSRVSLIVNDARAFMTTTKNKYDLIVFALTDSLVKVSPVAQLRLENYIYTEDSIRRARSLLNPGGDLLFYNQYRKPWLIDKMKIMIHDATGNWPRLVFERNAFAVLLAGDHNLAPAPVITDTHIAPARDDWPFPYLKDRSIPGIYVVAMAGLGLLAAFLVVFVHRSSATETSDVKLNLKLAFLLMGVAFLLLETKSVIQFSLLFGTTWINSSLVFLGVLALVLAANWTALLFNDSRRVLWVAYAFLLLFCLLALIYPLSNLLYVQNRILRFAAATLLTFFPIYFANLIFSITFRGQKLAEHLFGWNLIGATVGGILEYTSMAIGYSALGVIVAACYTIVFILLLSTKTPQAAVSQ